MIGCVGYEKGVKDDCKVVFFFLMLFLCLFLLKKLKKEDEGEAGFILEVDSKHLI